MRARIVGLAGAFLSLTAVGALTIAQSPANAAPVEYVKICSLYGAGYYYIPGTDICLNDTTNDAREQTAGGTWEWREPNNSYTFVRPNTACSDGRLVKLGEFSSSDLTIDPHGRFVTTNFPVKLGKHEFIKSVIYKGGFTGTGVGAGNFCIFYFFNDPTTGLNYQPLGCINTASFADMSTVLVFTPDVPVPPTPPTPTDQISLLGANGELWDVTSPSDIQGELKVWLCVR